MYCPSCQQGTSPAWAWQGSDCATRLLFRSKRGPEPATTARRALQAALCCFAEGTGPWKHISMCGLPAAGARCSVRSAEG